MEESQEPEAERFITTIQKWGRQSRTLLLLGWAMACSEAVVAALIWNWFAVPLGAPAITVVHALGLMTLLVLLRDVHPKISDKAAKSQSEDFAMENVFTSGRALLIARASRLVYCLIAAWVLHFFV